MLCGVSCAAAKLFKGAIMTGWQRAMSVRLTNPSMLPLSTTGSFFIFFRNINRRAVSKLVPTAMTSSGLDITALTFVFSGFLDSTITRFKRSLSVIMPIALPFLIAI